jgi:8-oxo-dGTP diphosphatase
LKIKFVKKIFQSMNQLAVINPQNVSENEAVAFAMRDAARAIVVDSEGQVALLHVSNKGYYKLPGGGIEDGEDKIEALRRECREEVGCEISDITEIGFIVEYRKSYNLKQTSYCYLAKLKGEKGTPNFTEAELAGGFEEVWLPFDEVQKKMAESTSLDLEGSQFIVPRDTIFLREAKRFT